MLDQVCGPVTGVNLEHMTPLMLPWTQDPWGEMRPPVSVEAMRMSAELAAATYHMEIERWLQAGWRDVTIQVDNDLLTDFLPRYASGTVNRLTTGWRMHRVRAKMQQRNPIGQMAGALRQIKQSDTGKVLVMLHPAPMGRYVVAISFMGTGTRFYDWFSNFRMTSQEGIHKGFLQLARQFEGNEEKILFPATAKELGLEKLTLRQVIKEAAQPNSRFVLWLSGHSQGGAVMQVWAYHKLHEDGVLPHHLLGYGFASPTAFEGRAVPKPSAYPLYHVLNGDDLVPRMGAQIHLGMCLYYPTDVELRSQCYAWPRDAESVKHRKAVYPILAKMTDTPSCIIAGLAYLEALADQPTEDMLEGLAVLGMEHLPLERVINAADSRMDDLMRFFRRKITMAYVSITGEEINLKAVAMLKEQILALIRQMGVKGIATALMEMMNWAHKMKLGQGASIAAYPYITLYGVERLRPFVWQGGVHPFRRYAGAVEEIAPEAMSISALVVRRRALPARINRHPHTYTQTHRGTRRALPLPTQYGGRHPGERVVWVKE